MLLIQFFATAVVILSRLNDARVELDVEQTIPHLLNMGKSWVYKDLDNYI